jgi:hypothetical protein
VATEVLKEALDKLSDGAKLWSDSIPDVVSKITATAETIITKSLAHQRLILKLVKNATFDQEEMIYELIPENDMDLKRQIIRTKLLYRDLKFVPIALLERAFLRLPIKVRAQLVLASDDLLKAKLYKLMGSGSRKAEVLEAEISQFQKSEKKMAEITENKSGILNDFMYEIRSVISDENQWVDLILKAQSDPNESAGVEETLTTAA